MAGFMLGSATSDTRLRPIVRSNHPSPPRVRRQAPDRWASIRTRISHQPAGPVMMIAQPHADANDSRETSARHRRRCGEAVRVSVRERPQLFADLPCLFTRLLCGGPVFLALLRACRG